MLCPYTLVHDWVSFMTKQVLWQLTLVHDLNSFMTKEHSFMALILSSWLISCLSENHYEMNLKVSSWLKTDSWLNTPVFMVRVSSYRTFGQFMMKFTGLTIYYMFTGPTHSLLDPGSNSKTDT